MNTSWIACNAICSQSVVLDELLRIEVGEDPLASERPSSWPKKRKAAAHYVTGKPDVDNVCKLVADAMNGIAYRDDAQIAELVFSHLYTDEQERAEVIVRELSAACDRLDAAKRFQLDPDGLNVAETIGAREKL